MPTTHQNSADLEAGRKADALSFLSAPNDPRFQRAMRNTCEVCDAKRGRPCWNTIDSEAPLPGRLIHHARTRPKGQGKEPKDDD
jgi:hypothetical protein